MSALAAGLLWSCALNPQPEPPLTGDLLDGGTGGTGRPDGGMIADASADSGGHAGSAGAGGEDPGHGGGGGTGGQGTGGAAGQAGSSWTDAGGDVSTVDATGEDAPDAEPVDSPEEQDATEDAEGDTTPD